MKFLNTEIAWEFNFRWLPFDWQKCELIYTAKGGDILDWVYDAQELTILDDITIAEWDIIDDDIEEETISPSIEFDNVKNSSVIA